MSIALQSALLFASLAIVVMAICVVPIAFRIGRSVKDLALTAERLEASARNLLQDSRELVRNVSDLSNRTNRHMEEVGKVARIVHLWVEGVDQFARQIGSLAEPPVLTLVRNSSLLRVGAAAFVRTLLHPHQQEQSKNRSNPTKEEQEHV